VPDQGEALAGLAFMHDERRQATGGRGLGAARVPDLGLHAGGHPQVGQHRFGELK
jgi:hypothetical protein